MGDSLLSARLCLRLIIEIYRISLQQSGLKRSFSRLTFSRSGSRRARASSLLSITEAAATSRGVEPLMEGDAGEQSGEKQLRIRPGTAAEGNTDRGEGVLGVASAS